MLELVDLLDMGFDIDYSDPSFTYFLVYAINSKIRVEVKFKGRGGYNEGSITSRNLHTMEVIVFKNITLDDFCSLTGFEK